MRFQDNKFQDKFAISGISALLEPAHCKAILLLRGPTQSNFCDSMYNCRVHIRDLGLSTLEDSRTMKWCKHVDLTADWTEISQLPTITPVSDTTEDKKPLHNLCLHIIC